MWKAPVYRNSYKKRYGSHCFLRPRDKAYPVCTKGRFDCKGIQAALYYTRLNKDKKLMRKAQTLKRLCKKLKRSS
jgi:hypothetical protein